MNGFDNSFTENVSSYPSAVYNGKHMISDVPKPDSVLADDVANFLLNHKFYLSALEYYFEQVERGHIIPNLHSFFADPSFVENVFPRKEDGLFTGVRCQSVSTLDSIDFGRISDDGNCVDEKIKVLEYELRKRNEEIDKLRKELTSLTLSQCNDVEIRAARNLVLEAAQSDNVQPFEARALSVLIHDHLLRNGYRFTAVQFAEESGSAGLEDVESWEQVGVNHPKPPDLLSLLRYYWSGGTNHHTDQKSVFSIGTDPEQVSEDLRDGEPLCDDQNTTFELQNRLEEIASLQAQVIMFETRNAQLETQAQQLRNQLICLEREHAEVVGCPSGSSQQNSSLPTGDTQGYSHSDHRISVLAEPSIRSRESVCTRSPNSRYSSEEFLEFMTDLLPTNRTLKGTASRTFHLATSLDDFVAIVSDRLESLLPLLRDDYKIMSLPLLTQVICLHPDSTVRDRLLRLLFNLFPTNSHSLNDTLSALCNGDLIRGRLSLSPNDLLTASDNRHHTIILSECRRLASYMGPTRIESELIPQLWSQLNQRPPPSDIQRLLIVSACGVISPSVPAHLRSSLMLSILESNLDEERNELVRAGSIRSLACLVSLMSDWDKLPQLVHRLNRLLSNESTALPELRDTTATPLDPLGTTPAIVATVDWLLPAIAEWCLELDNLHTTLIDFWLDHIDSYILSMHSSSDQFPFVLVLHALAVLDHLVPFIHAWILVTLVKPLHPEQTYWYAANSWAVTQQGDAENQSKMDQPVDESNSNDSVTNTRIILGHRVYCSLRRLFQQTVDELETAHQPGAQPTAIKWTAQNWLHAILLPKLVKLLCSLPNQTANSRSSAKCSSGLAYNSKQSLELYATKQYDQYSAYPWSQPVASEYMSVCLAVCRLLHTFGSCLGEQGMEKLLAIPFRDALMNRTELGNFEYDHQAMQTSLLAGYCVLLASVKSKSRTAQVRVLLTNAVFLHVRESYPFDSVRMAIWCLCVHTDTEYAVLELILPALRPCVGCADAMVRRASATLLHTVVECLRSGVGGTNQGQKALLDPIFQMVNQLARDDLTGQRKFINQDEADWSVLAIALGPLYSLLQLYRTISKQPGDNRGPVADTISVESSCSLDKSSSAKDSTDFEERLYELVRLQYDLVINRSDSTSSYPDSASTNGFDPAAIEFAQHHFWHLLTVALLTLSDRLLPSCSDSFRDSVLLPWLCRLAELNNSLPNLGQRARLADQLFAVFSTAAYSVQMEESLLLWLVPGLGRVRLDLTEAGDTVRTHEVEQFLNDLYARIKSDDASLTKPKESTAHSGRRIATTTLAKLAVACSSSAQSQINSGWSSVGIRLKQHQPNSRLSLKKR